ncbi:peroxiredoxin-like 2A isoform X5 [Dermochelys coriacea]|uniref:peroxiredoxin-like 2A isoform X5 n=1 Tax=Dermochelys coriacea TaxID=27794 RepID=UPI001CA9D440|nr:peroxiredoxin-like 2A isoform X5 [Dermochelys coriacea]
MGSEMSSLPDLELFTMGMWSIGLGAIGVAVTGILLANTDLFLSKPEVASLEFLETTELKSLGEAEERTFKAGELWKKNGAVIMAVRRPGCFLCREKKFYGPHKRKMLLMGFIRLGVWQNFLRAWKNGYGGNLEGEGFILGGVYVIGAGKQGVLLEHREREFGDKVNLQSVLEAAEKIKPQAADTE